MTKNTLEFLELLSVLPGLLDFVADCNWAMHSIRAIWVST